ncbi:MAG: hypothetical protein IKX70_05065 [Treponema sp.]|nr:hypothetical protein [Treponema sp.]
MKNKLKILTAGLLLTFAAAHFTSCGYEPVFYGIMHDVLPEAATVTGNINSIARCAVGSDEYLFVSNGGSLLYKSIDANHHGAWTNSGIALPFAPHHYNFNATASEGEGHQGQQILYVLSDKDNLYLLTANYKQDDEYGIGLPDTVFLWTCSLSDVLLGDSSKWKTITTPELPTSYDTSTTQFVMDFYLFSSNTPQASHRRAYLAIKTSSAVKYYKLKGQNDPEEINIDSNIIKKVNLDSTNIRSSFFLGNTEYFSDSLVVATNETKDDEATVAVLTGVSSNAYSTDVLYKLTEEMLNSNADVKPESFISIGSPVASLAFTNDSLLVGKGSYTSSYTSNGGISRILLDSNGVPQSSTAAFTNNAPYQFTSSYILMTLLCADPSKAEAQASIYATITYRGSSGSTSATFNDIGLWSYYPARGNWNRE